MKWIVKRDSRKLGDRKVVRFFAIVPMVDSLDGHWTWLEKVARVYELRPMHIAYDERFMRGRPARNYYCKWKLILPPR